MTDSIVTNRATALVTGGTGFIGRRLVTSLLQDRIPVRVLTRNSRQADIANEKWRGAQIEWIEGDLTAPHSLQHVCDDIDTVFHLASYSPNEAFHGASADNGHDAVSALGTRKLVEQAREAGVRRVVFVSSVKVMGEYGAEGWDETYPSAPTSAYGRAKLAAEQSLYAILGERSAVLRLPPVYGPGGRGVVERIIHFINRGWLPPFPETHAKRSIVYVDDVVSALRLLASRDDAAGQTYLITDGETYTVRRISHAVREALGYRPQQWEISPTLLRSTLRACETGARILKMRGDMARAAAEWLFEPAWYRDDRIRNSLGFTARTRFEDALMHMIADERRGRDAD
jgi:nucleoside-diphosphate-sugar epimerase